MPKPKDHQLNFPLEELLRRLELAGFHLSPADRLRALRVLAGPGKEHLASPEKLKYLLGPVLTRAAADQERFYTIFDSYIEEAQESDWLTDPLAKEEEEEDFQLKWWQYLLGLLALAGIIWGIIQIAKPRPIAPIPHFEGPAYAGEGDSVFFKNSTALSQDTADYRWLWEYYNPGRDEVIWVDSQSYDLSFNVPTLSDTNYQHELIFRVAGPDDAIGEYSYVYRKDFDVLCPIAPDVAAILRTPSSDVNTEQQIYFRPQTSNRNAPWVYEWDFGDGTTATGMNQYHQYDKEGKFTIQLNIRDTSSLGFCSIKLSETIRVGAMHAYLPTLPLEKDRIAPVATFQDWVWYAFGGLGLLTLILWIQWLGKRLRKPPVIRNIDPQEARFKTTDKAPYFIPFRSQDKNLSFHPAQFRLADAMRLRQLDTRKIMDVKSTLKATIEEGGYPRVRYAYSTRPSEYLILVDEQTDVSHLGHLFRHLASEIRGQDVHADVYLYRRHFNRFWNNEHPEGLTLELLARHYPRHRLLILGDAHDMMDPGASGRPKLKQDIVADLRAWQERLLLTPLPPVSWSYREKLLYQFFALYPADLDGIADAALWLESDGDINIVDYKSWHSRHLELRSDPDTEYRKWKRWKDHKEYLEAYPNLDTWFLALAVYPRPNWELTIAIGRALSDWGVDVNHDSLLWLARIPALQMGRFETRLRRGMLEALDPEVEKIARRTVREELDAVRALTQNGHAGRELETEVAVQDFALEPEDEEARNAIRYLMREAILTPVQQAELETVLGKQSSTGIGDMFQKQGGRSKKVDLEEYLGTNIQKDKKEEKRPFLSWPFLRAAAASLGLLALFALMNEVDHTAQLYRWSFGQEPQEVLPFESEEHHSSLFSHEEFLLDSAMLYHNEAIDQYRQNNYDLAETLLWEADRAKRYDYPEASTNLRRLYFNRGSLTYNGFQYDSLDQSVLNSAIDYFNAAINLDSVQALVIQAAGDKGPITGVFHHPQRPTFNALHGLGLSRFYLGQRQAAEVLYQQLDSTTNFFDTFSLSPNLQILLDQGISRIVSINPKETGGKTTSVTVDVYISNVNEVDIVRASPIINGVPNDRIKDQDNVNSSGPLSYELNLAPDEAVNGKSDSILIELINAGGQLVDSRRVFYEKQWGRRPTTTNRPTRKQYTSIGWRNSYFKPIETGKYNVIVSNLGNVSRSQAEKELSLWRKQHPDFYFDYSFTQSFQNSDIQAFIYLGTGLSLSEANEVVQIAKDYNIAKDAYASQEEGDTVPSSIEDLVAKYVIQLGTFADLSQAQSYANNLNEDGLFGNTEVYISENRNQYRAILGPYTGQANADAALRIVKNNKLSGYIIQDEGQFARIAQTDNIPIQQQQQAPPTTKKEPNQSLKFKVDGSIPYADITNAVTLLVLPSGEVQRFTATSGKNFDIEITSDIINPATRLIVYAPNYQPQQFTLTQFLLNQGTVTLKPIALKVEEVLDQCANCLPCVSCRNLSPKARGIGNFDECFDERPLLLKAISLISNSSGKRYHCEIMSVEEQIKAQPLRVGFVIDCFSFDAKGKRVSKDRFGSRSTTHTIRFERDFQDRAAQNGQVGICIMVREGY